jgi:hypothetical protein
LSFKGTRDFFRQFGFSTSWLQEGVPGEFEGVAFGMYNSSFHIKALQGITISVLSILMFYAALRKIIDYEMFENEVAFSLANIDAGNLIFISRFCEVCIFLQCALEFTAAGLMLTNKRRLVGLYLTFSAVVITSIYLLVVIQINYSISIFFGGILPGASMGLHLVFNFVALVISLVGIYVAQK